MEEQLREHLMEGERLLWSGSPESFETLDKTNKTSIIVGFVIKALITLGILLLLIISARENGGGKPGAFAFVLALAAFAFANPFLIARRLRKKTFYGLTDKRILRAGANEQAVPYDRIRNAVLRTDADGHTTLLCGSRAIKLKPHQWRGEADVSFINSAIEPEAERVILYALPMNDELKGILNQYLPLE